MENPDLDKRSFSFVIRASEHLQSGDVVVVREVRDKGNGEQEIVAVADKVIREEAEKLLAD